MHASHSTNLSAAGNFANSLQTSSYVNQRAPGRVRNPIHKAHSSEMPFPKQGRDVESSNWQRGAAQPGGGHLRDLQPPWLPAETGSGC